MSDPFDPQMLSDDDGFDDLAALRAIGRDLPTDDLGWDNPPDDLWARIEAEAFGASEPRSGAPAPQPPVTGAGGDSADTPVVPFPGPNQHRHRWLVPVAAVAAAIVVVVGLVIGNATGTDDPEVLASVVLDVLGDTGSGRAELVNADGVKQIRLETADLDAGDGFLEVWVIDPSVTKLVSLGPLRPDGIYDLPAGLNPADFPIVDVSVEPVDGDPTHSGDSVLRGRLTI